MKGWAGAVGAGRERAATPIGPRKAAAIGTRQREAGNAQGGVARVIQDEGLSTARSYGLLAEE